MSDVVMPRLSDTMEEGTILRWLKRDGEHVARGEDLVEIETDKAAMNYQSDQEGVVELLAAEGDTLPIGAPIARVGEGVGATDGTAVEIDEEPALEGPAGGLASGSATERVRASPLARRIAREGGIELSALSGSGPGGRIVKADVVAQAGGAAASAPSAPAPTAPGAPAASATGAVANDEAPAAAPSASLEGVATAKGDTTTLELTRTQQTVARRMAESKATIPDFTLQVDVDMDECVRLRAELKRLARPEAAGELSSAAGSTAIGGLDPTGERAPGAELATPTYNDMVVKASALALREHPRANSSYKDGRLLVHSRVNVGVAVAADGALVVPTIFDADSKALGEIARETRALAGRVRAGTITPPELGGGTFTVSNLGMYGIDRFAAIINPPQAAIIAVGALAQRPLVRDGGLQVGNVMTLTLACDHRVVYGAEAAQLLTRVRELLESPAALTL